MHRKVVSLCSEQREEMRIETRSNSSDRKLVVFVLRGTRYFIKPENGRDILYTFTGPPSRREARA